MPLPAELLFDLEKLKALGYETETPPLEAGNEALVVFPMFPVPQGKYNMENVRLLVRVPLAYPNAGLDMFYTQPDLKLASGASPQQSEVLETLAGAVWRRFSWHRNIPWIPGRDSLVGFVSFIEDNLARGR